ncbi:amidase [Skermanella aerolata]|uniref:Amidase n=1 Tax=Skermanella aerolata TaxID=393310 RepID=A0A512DZ69_9PROT|nr:amidase [Skermanella aerolata]KJB93353.1 amidase [Skermanella aerolata KACC 11604]GEO41490.1 amidase [Skermanella aerolata]
MPIKKPSREAVLDVGRTIGLSLTSAEAEEFATLMGPSVEQFNQVDRMRDELPEVKYPRTPGYRPMVEDNPYNAWYVKTTIEGAPGGKLSGKTVVLKDNIMLAGVPMMNGSATLEGYVPEIDATIVTRLLDAGATIVGKSHCEAFCLSGGSHTNITGPVHNPLKHGYSAGGSSSGSAALVAAGEVDLAVGGDQGGSIRMPASFCGIYGMKPTHGLVPYTGIMPIEIFVDHTGPMTRTVKDNALMLEVMAGPDGYDPRQYDVKTAPYAEMLEGGVKGMTIGVVKEGFGHPDSEEAVDAAVRRSAEHFAKLGATVKEISIPMHREGVAIWMPIGVLGLTQTMMYGDGYGLSRPDLYVSSLMDRHHSWRQRADELSETTKLMLLLGTYVLDKRGVQPYGKAINIARRLRAAYDAALADCDLLLMPTTPMKATPMPEADAPVTSIVKRAFEMITNTAPFDITHHPAMAVPCGLIDGLPASTMLIGKHFDEATIYKAAYAFEQSGGAELKG